MCPRNNIKSCGAHAGGASAAITALLEGESLFNDASSITLFEVFLGLVRRLEEGDHSDMGFGQTAYELVTRILVLSIGEVLPDVHHKQFLGSPLEHVVYM